MLSGRMGQRDAYDEFKAGVNDTISRENINDIKAVCAFRVRSNHTLSWWMESVCAIPNRVTE